MKLIKLQVITIYHIKEGGHGAGMALFVKNTIKSSTIIENRLPGHVFFLSAKYG